MAHKTVNSPESEEKPRIFRGARLRDLRKRRGLSQDRLAELVETVQQQVSNWETGVYEPEYPTLTRLATLLDVSTDYLLGLVNNEQEYITLAPRSVLMERLEWALDKGLIQEALEAFTLLAKPPDQTDVSGQ